MGILMFLAPTSIALGLMGLAAFWWTVRNDQYEDPQGDAARILNDHEDDGPPA
jgi:cbb3-type cytochrome oxidase maturation protein